MLHSIINYLPSQYHLIQTTKIMIFSQIFNLVSLSYCQLGSTSRSYVISIGVFYNQQNIHIIVWVCSMFNTSTDSIRNASNPNNHTQSLWIHKHDSNNTIHLPINHASTLTLQCAISLKFLQLGFFCFLCWVFMLLVVGFGTSLQFWWCHLLCLFGACVFFGSLQY